MRSLKKRGPHVLDDLNDLLFSLQAYRLRHGHYLFVVSADNVWKREGRTDEVGFHDAG